MNTKTMLANRKLSPTKEGRPMTWFVDEQVSAGNWREEVVPANVVGLSRDISVFKAHRKTNHIVFFWHGDDNTFCPPTWYDEAIGSGSCGLGCRACFLNLTHRIRRDPMRHTLYDNVDVFIAKMENWLKHPDRKPQHTMGIGIDRSDSLLYEGVVPYVRSQAPLFGNRNINKNGNLMVLLTKTANTHWLKDVNEKDRQFIVVTFSLNPEHVANLWEGLYPDTLERITPPISKRIEAARYAQELGFQVRARLDPVIPCEGWQEIYSDFVSDVKKAGVNFEYWTLGTYREKNDQLDTWREKWGLPPMGWDPSQELISDGTHWHLKKEDRIEIYTHVKNRIHAEFGSSSKLGVCKETRDIRKQVGITGATCNCLFNSGSKLENKE